MKLFGFHLGQMKEYWEQKIGATNNNCHRKKEVQADNSVHSHLVGHSKKLNDNMHETA